MITPVTDEDIQIVRRATFEASGGPDAIGAFARVELELRALRKVVDAAVVAFGQDGWTDENADRFHAALRDAGRLP